MKKFSAILCLLLSLLVLFAGCGNKTDDDGPDGSQSPAGSTSSEDFFEWEENIIVGLTEKGTRQKAVVIPARCEGFSGMIFADVENDVASVSFESDADIVLNGVFRCAPNIRSVALPQQLTTIDNMEFWQCSSLEEIEIPASVATIGKYAFQAGTSLKEVRFAGNVDAILGHAFDGCTSLETIVLPDTVTQIDEYAFYGCTSLKSVTLPKALKTVGGFAFANNGIADITVPAELSLESYANTLFVQAEHTVGIHVTEGSWADQNFDMAFDSSCTKQYS